MTTTGNGVSVAKTVVQPVSLLVVVGISVVVVAFVVVDVDVVVVVVVVHGGSLCNVRKYVFE